MYLMAEKQARIILINRIKFSQLAELWVCNIDAIWKIVWTRTPQASYVLSKIEVKQFHSFLNRNKYSIKEVHFGGRAA